MSKGLLSRNVDRPPFISLRQIGLYLLLKCVGFLLDQFDLLLAPTLFIYGVVFPPTKLSDAKFNLILESSFLLQIIHNSISISGTISNHLQLLDFDLCESAD